MLVGLGEQLLVAPARVERGCWFDDLHGLVHADGPGQDGQCQLRVVLVGDQGTLGASHLHLGAQHIGLSDLPDPEAGLGLSELVLGEPQGVLGDRDLLLRAQDVVVGPGYAEEDFTDSEIVALQSLAYGVPTQLQGGRKRRLDERLGNGEKTLPTLPWPDC